MKKLLFLLPALLLFAQLTFAQSLENPTGEVRLNFLNTIIIGSVELGYEHFVGHDQSIGVELHINDRFNYRSASGGRDFDATSILLSYNFYFAGDENGKLHISPFFKYRFGEFREAVDGSGVTTTDLNSGYIGLIGGYKWNYNNFAFGPFAAVARGFSSKVADRFNAVEFRAGLNVGYRF
ncbi:hypothetical protein [Cecembia lonarensis]|uniref:DUF3575 domain-containing protein n=1 Tax=Cecembia lonarensis (strain CCUG 58316 / KCTC 22772 / LW9) TaxID=1225176 RepID=K1M0M9_CECL9|nr:hypothetical protein [Cecembia lonarensis]EKB49894.1 hypothetical protein B879_01446 [Cecembia lonarensis LW9]